MSKKYMCISYVPMLVGAAGEVIEDEELHEKLKKAHHGMAKGCMFVEREGRMHPVFIISNADAIYNHMLFWSDQSPDEWFTVYIHEPEPNYYAIVLHPNIKRSLDRYKAAAEILRGETLSDDDINVVYRPITFLGGKTDAYFKHKKKLPKNQINVGFLDSNKVTVDIEASRLLSDFENVEDDIKWIGPVRFGKDKTIIDQINKSFQRLRISTRQEEPGDPGQG